METWAKMLSFVKCWWLKGLLVVVYARIALSSDIVHR